jgi:uncharacterized protein UPF0158
MAPYPDESSPQTIRIELEEIIEAMQDSNEEFTHYLDRTTGAILMVIDPDYVDTEDLEEDVAAKIEENPDRYLEVPPTRSSDAFRIMESFADAQSGSAKAALKQALDGRKPFRRFQDALHDLGPLRDEWFKFERSEFGELARKWLRFEDIDAELIDSQAT